MEYQYFIDKDRLLVRKDSNGIYTWLPRAYNGWQRGIGPHKLTPVGLNSIPEYIHSSYTNPVFKKLLKESFYKDILGE